MKRQSRNDRFQISDFRFQISDFRFQISNFKLNRVIKPSNNQITTSTNPQFNEKRTHFHTFTLSHFHTE